MRKKNKYRACGKRLFGRDPLFGEHCSSLGQNTGIGKIQLNEKLISLIITVTVYLVVKTHKQCHPG